MLYAYGFKSLRPHQKIFLGVLFRAKRIIENGKYNVVTCSDCECKFSFDKRDIEANGTVICPQCAKANTPVVKK